jgi:hypothetical protein
MDRPLMGSLILISVVAAVKGLLAEHGQTTRAGE